MRVDFGPDSWAEIFSATEMPRRVTARIQDMIADLGEDEPAMRYVRHMSRMRDTLMAMLVKQWSYGEPPGDEPEGLYELPQAAYDKLTEATEDHWEKAGFPREETTGEEEPKPKSGRGRKPANSTSSA